MSQRSCGATSSLTKVAIASIARTSTSLTCATAWSSPTRPKAINRMQRGQWIEASRPKGQLSGTASVRARLTAREGSKGG